MFPAILKFLKFLKRILKVFLKKVQFFLKNGKLCHLRSAYFKFFSNHGGQFQYISSHLRPSYFKIFSNHGGQFKYISSHLRASYFNKIIIMFLLVHWISDYIHLFLCARRKLERLSDDWLKLPLALLDMTILIMSSHSMA